MDGGTVNAATEPFPLNKTMIGPKTMHNPVNNVQYHRNDKKMEYDN